MTPVERAAEVMARYVRWRDAPIDTLPAARALDRAGLLVTEQDLEFRAMVEARKKRAEGRRAARQQAQL